MEPRRVVLLSKDSELCGLIVKQVVPCWTCTVVGDWRQTCWEELSGEAVWMVDLALGRDAVMALEALFRGG
ncbi:MAG TPA: hypothetical protein GX507_09970 [Clostridia bacterium]|nr:hypothetical protein [Clostridia bacterium]